MTSDRGSERIAEALRDEPPELDEVARARMEKRLLDGVRARETDESRPVAPRRRGPAAKWVVAGVAVAAAAAGIGLVWAPGSEPGGSPETSASFTAFRDGESVGRGVIGEGEVVETAARERVEVRFDVVRVDVTPRSRVRFERVSGDMRVRLERGAVEVEFHPERRGDRRLAVETTSARVEVVGTVFRVEVDVDGATEVAVDEGVVRVTPHGSGSPRLVRGGERTRVELTVAQTASVGRSGADRDRAASETGTADDVVPATRRDREPAPEHDEDDEITPAEEPPASAAARIRAGAPEGPALSLDARFELAEQLHQRGQYERARHELLAITRSPARPADRVRAWSMIADSWVRQGDPRRAAEALRRAHEAGPDTQLGHAALFDRAKILERRVGDASAARAAYSQYLQRVPNGPNAAQARAALCRLGEEWYCP
jgi:TolA-binding protein